MTERLTLVLDQTEMQQLRQSARADLRRPRDQAKFLVLRGLGLAVATNEPNKHNCAVPAYQGTDGAIVATQ